MNLEGMTIPELVALRQKIEDDPKSRSVSDSLFRFTPSARKRLGAIDMQITYSMGGFKGGGYSGRNCNKRR